MKKENFIMIDEMAARMIDEIQEENIITLNEVLVTYKKEEINTKLLYELYANGSIEGITVIGENLNENYKEICFKNELTNLNQQYYLGKLWKISENKLNRIIKEKDFCKEKFSKEYLEECFNQFSVFTIKSSTKNNFKPISFTLFDSIINLFDDIHLCIPQYSHNEYPCKLCELDKNSLLYTFYNFTSYNNWITPPSGRYEALVKILNTFFYIFFK